VEHFSEVEGLDTDALRRLLKEGTPRERVWAAWGLGLRLGAGALPELERASRREPDPGARRHLLVVLAGHRDIDLLTVIARDDPDEYVRASACQYLARVAPDVEAVRTLLRERLEVEASREVRSAILRHLPGVRQEDFVTVVHALADDVLELRWAALDALTAAGERALPVLRERAWVEPDAGLAQAIRERWLELVGPAALLEECLELPPERAAELLWMLAETGQRFGWEDLALLTLRGESTLDLAVLACLRQEAAPAEARMWLEDLLVQGYEGTVTQEAREAAWKALRPLLEALRTVHAEDLELPERLRLGQVRALLQRLCARSRHEEDSGEEDLYEDEDGCWSQEPEDELLALLRQLLPD
jgi:hypothetical protein